MQESNRNFFLLLTGQMVSLFGSSVHLVAVILYIKELTGMAAALGIFQLVAYLPIILLSPYGGILADSYSRKRLIIYTDLLRGLIMIALGLLYLRGMLTYAVLLTGTFIISICSALFHPAAHALFPDLVSAETLKRKNALKSTTLLGANFAGSSLGGVAFSVFGPAAVFIFNGFSFCVSAAEESFITYRAPSLHTKHPPDGLTILSSLAAQFRELRDYMRREKGISTVLLTYALVSGLYPPVILSLPFLLEQQYLLGPEFFGIAMALLIGGGGAGALIFGFTDRDRRSNSTVFFSAMAVLSPLLLIIGFSRSPAIPFLILPAAGFCIGLMHQIMTTTLYQRVQGESRGRIFGVMESLASFTVPLSYAAGGFIIQLLQNRLPWFYLLMGGLLLLLALYISLGTKVRGFLNESEASSRLGGHSS